ncbi:hypothetical protein AAF712_000323 [Marasmius tenuissimus]|uniref:Uncharacterized protein n=1 Tax=Marasmius tenuissimus TaxID=585030 RepID=A0ABR3AG74_9AGAR
MKFFITFTALIAVAVAAAALEPGPVASLEERSDLEARACSASKCVCNKVQGQFCGNQAINPDCKNGHVYECNKSTGKTCDYGVRTSCQQCGKLSC